MPLIINFMLLTLTGSMHRHTSMLYGHMAGGTSGDWWIQVGEPGNVARGMVGHMDRISEVTCCLSAVTISSIHRTLKETHRNTEHTPNTACKQASAHVRIHTHIQAF